MRKNHDGGFLNGDSFKDIIKEHNLSDEDAQELRDVLEVYMEAGFSLSSTLREKVSTFADRQPLVHAFSRCLVKVRKENPS